MNLWAKSLRQLLVLSVALIFFSCEDETSIIGYPNPKKKFEVFYVEVPLDTRVLLLSDNDSIITDNAFGPGLVMAGEYMDNVLGKVTTLPFVQVFPGTTTKINATSVFDSTTIQFRLNFYSYGFEGIKDLRFSVRPLLSELEYDSSRYFYNSTVPYGTTSVAEVGIKADYDKLQENLGKTSQDTFLLAGRLEDELGLAFFTAAKENPDSILQFFDRFRPQFKGFTLVPLQSDGILDLNLASALSSVIVHYHTLDAAGGVMDTLTRSFPFNQGSFNTAFTNISVDRSASPLAGAVPLQTIDPGVGIIQSGSPVITKLDISNFYTMFADMEENIIINSAELLMENVESPTGTKPHANLILRIMDEDNSFVKIYNEESRVRMNKFHVSPDGTRYNAFADLPSSAVSPADVTYSTTDKRYSGFITLFAQSLFKNKKYFDATNDKRIRYLGIYPSSPSMARSVTRTILDKTKITLRIHYTRPTETQ